jgi:DNA gyrase/topoisomerase IV subunit A
MIEKKDIQWWVLEATKYPDRAPEFVRMLAERITELDRQNETLRADLIAIRRQTIENAASGDRAVLQRRITELEAQLAKAGATHRGGQRRLMLYTQGHLHANIPYSQAEIDGFPELPTAPPQLLMCNADSRLIAINTDSRVFSVSVADLPTSPTVIESPPNVVAYLDQGLFEVYRYLVLISQKGYAYSLIAGSISRLVTKQDKLIRNGLPDDPIIAAIHTNNTDLLAVSHRGRWLRIPEKALGGSGSLLMETPKGDYLTAVTRVDGSTQVYVLSRNGRLFSRRSVDLPAKKAAGRHAGVLTTDPELIGVGVGSELLVITRDGHLIKVALDATLPARAESEAGYAIPGAESGVLTYTFC